MKKLGFGCMRLPVVDGRFGEIDKAAVCRMIDAFMEKGFSYFDTAWFYHESKSEIAVRECLVKRYPRSSFQLADKMPVKLLNREEEMEEYFSKQLEKCGVEYFDYYLLHDLGRERYPLVKDFHAFEFIQKKKKEGKIRNIGFSFHDTADVLEMILSEHPEVDFVQLQINYLDWESAAIQSRKCYETASSHGKKVVVMEPVKGGTLANVSEEVEKLFKAHSPSMSVASWAIRFAAGLDNVFMVLSGMSNMQQLCDNMSYMENFVPLDDEEKKIIKAATDEINSDIAIPCTGCSYCINDCPMEIEIPKLFSLYNADMQEMKGKPFTTQIAQYDHMTKMSGKASSCADCGQCEEMCPQHLHIRELLKKVADHFE